MTKDALTALAAGAASALASVAVAFGVPGSLFIMYLAPLPLFLVGLGQGPRWVAIAAAAGFATAGFASGTAAAGMFGIMHAVPAWMVTRQALMQGRDADGNAVWYPSGAILGWLTLMAGGLFLIAAGLLWGEGGMRSGVEAHLDEVFRLMAPQLADADRGQLVSALADIFPGAVGVSWIVMTAINAVMAQAILVRSGRALRPSPGIGAMTLPDWTSWLLVGGASLALLGGAELGYIGRNLTVILAVPFFFLGLAVAHAAARRTAYATMLLAGLYLVLIISTTAVMLVAGVGVIEQWVGLRQRIKGPDVGEEN